MKYCRKNLIRVSRLFYHDQLQLDPGSLRQLGRGIRNPLGSIYNC